jgi:hypothetical protein
MAVTAILIVAFILAYMLWLIDREDTRQQREQERNWPYDWTRDRELCWIFDLEEGHDPADLESS